MPTRTTRSTRTPAAGRSSRPRRAAGTSSTRRGASARRTSTARRGLAGGWLQRRQPEPSGIKKAMSTARRALPGSKGSSAVAAAGLALVGAAGVALRKRGQDHDAHDHAPTTSVNPPVSGPPTATVTTPPDTSAVTTDSPTPPAAP